MSSHFFALFAGARLSLSILSSILSWVIPYSISKADADAEIKQQSSKSGGRPLRPAIAAHLNSLF